MQNIPGIELESTVDKYRAAMSNSAVKREDANPLFAELFDKHSDMVHKELALTPVSTKEEMLDTAPVKADEKPKETGPVTRTKPPVKEERPIEDKHGRDERMTQEDLDEVREDLEAYGMTKEEIAEIEEEINSEEGLTWGQFVARLSQKMADLRKVELDAEQKEELGNFFAKLGFTEKESGELIARLENGEQADVLKEIQAKIEAMPETKNLLITKDELQAFSAAMNFSKEFTAKLKENFAKNVLPKDMKEAFTLMRQEMANMDDKDRELVRAVGKQFAQAMEKNVKDSTAAKEIEQAVDLKPRVAEDKPKVETRHELKEEIKQEAKTDIKEAVETRRESLTETATRASDEKKAMPEKAKVQAEVGEQNNKQESENDTWNNFFAKLKDDSQQVRSQLQAKADAAQALKADATDLTAKARASNWEKVSAPKVMRQVETAFLQNLSNGTKRLTLQLTPENLGKLNVMLQVHGKEVSATIRAENPEAARIITENLEVIKNSLESQGLKVEKLDVQAGLADAKSDQNWFGNDQHNLARDREAMAHMRSHMKAMREGRATVAQDMQSIRESAIRAEQGLYVIA